MVRYDGRFSSVKEGSVKRQCFRKSVDPDQAGIPIIIPMTTYYIAHLLVLGCNAKDILIFKGHFDC